MWPPGADLNLGPLACMMGTSQYLQTKLVALTSLSVVTDRLQLLPNHFQRWSQQQFLVYMQYLGLLGFKLIMKLFFFFFFFTTVYGQTGFTDLYTRSLWMGQSTVQRPSHQLMQVYVGQSFECLKISTKYYVNEQLTLILDLHC